MGKIQSREQVVAAVQPPQLRIAGKIQLGQTIGRAGQAFQRRKIADSFQGGNIPAGHIDLLDLRQLFLGQPAVRTGTAQMIFILDPAAEVGIRESHRIYRNVSASGLLQGKRAGRQAAHQTNCHGQERGNDLFFPQHILLLYSR